MPRTFDIKDVVQQRRLFFCTYYNNMNIFNDQGTTSPAHFKDLTCFVCDAAREESWRDPTISGLLRLFQPTPVTLHHTSYCQTLCSRVSSLDLPP